MTNPANQLPSYDSDTSTKANSNYSCLPMGCTPVKIEHNQMVVKTGKRGAEGSKQLNLNYTAVTEDLKPDLMQQSILFGGARMAMRLMLITLITPLSKNSFVAT